MNYKRLKHTTYVPPTQFIKGLVTSFFISYSKDVSLPQQLQRAMAAEAEASREARAKVSMLGRRVAVATSHAQGQPPQPKKKFEIKSLKKKSLTTLPINN